MYIDPFNFTHGASRDSLYLRHQRTTLSIFVHSYSIMVDLMTNSLNLLTLSLRRGESTESLLL